MGFDLDHFIADAGTAVARDNRPGAVRPLLAQALADGSGLIAALGAPVRAGVTTLYRSDHLTILNFVWGPRMQLLPHNHRLWALIGIYTGREDNIFWRRRPDGADSKPDTRIEAAGAQSLSTGEIATLGPDIIHSVINPIPRLTGAVHIYGGDFFAPGRSQWDADSLCEEPYDVAMVMRLFEESNG